MIANAFQLRVGCPSLSRGRHQCRKWPRVCVCECVCVCCKCTSCNESSSSWSTRRPGMRLSVPQPQSKHKANFNCSHAAAAKWVCNVRSDYVKHTLKNRRKNLSKINENVTWRGGVPSGPSPTTSATLSLLPSLPRPLLCRTALSKFSFFILQICIFPLRPTPARNYS